MDNNYIKDEVLHAIDALKEKNAHGLNFGVYFSPKYMWAAR